MHEMKKVECAGNNTWYCRDQQRIYGEKGSV